MKTLMPKLFVFAIAGALATETLAEEWNVSVWGKRRAFTEHIHKLGELLDQKTNGEFTLNISYGGLSKNKENLDGISIGAFEMAQFCAGYHADKNRVVTVLELPFQGQAHTLDSRQLIRYCLMHPLDTALNAMPRILFQASVLSLRKKLKVFTRPRPVSKDTIIDDTIHKDPNSKL